MARTLASLPSGSRVTGLHQPRSGESSGSSGEDRFDLGRDRKDQHPAKRAAGAFGGVLRDRAGALHAVLLSRSATLLARRRSVAHQARRDRTGYWQVRHLASALASRRGTFAAAI